MQKNVMYFIPISYKNDLLYLLLFTVCVVSEDRLIVKLYMH